MLTFVRTESQFLENMVQYNKSNFLFKKIVGTKKGALPVTFWGLVEQCSCSESAYPLGEAPLPAAPAPFPLVPLRAACLQSPGPTGNPPTLMAFSYPGPPPMLSSLPGRNSLLVFPDFSAIHPLEPSSNNSFLGTFFALSSQVFFYCVACDDNHMY